MAISLYEISIPVFIRGLKILAEILKKGESYATEKGIEPSKLVNAKLHEDMASLIFQVQRVSDTARNTAVRVGAVDVLSIPDDEETFADLHNRILKTIDYLNRVEASSMDDKEESEVMFYPGSMAIKFTGKTYVLRYALPNFFFHVTTTYAILRHMGVPVGKVDYLVAKD